MSNLLSLRLNGILYAVLVVFSLLVLGLLSTKLQALTPPDPGAIEQYKQDGTYDERVRWAKIIGNHKADPWLIWDMNRRLHALMGTYAEPQAPPPTRRGLPTSGSPKVLVMLVDFSGYPHTADQTVADVQSKMFGSGDPAQAPYENLQTYYQRSSYNQLTITGNVLGWYRAAKPRSYYESLGKEGGKGQDTLIKEMISFYDQQGHDFSQYDNDGDGYVDAFFIKWTGPDNDWNNFWWAYLKCSIPPVHRKRRC